MASIVPPPEDPEERDEERSLPAAAPPRAAPGALSFSAAGPPRTRRAAAGTRVSVVVAVREPGDVAIEGLGLRASAEPRTPARFDLVAHPDGRYAVVFVPITGRERLAGRLVFAEPATVRRRAREG